MPTIDTAAAHARPAYRKIPEASAIFWLLKMMSTTVGETAADFFIADMHWGLPLTTAVAGVLLAVALAWQLRSRHYSPVAYWGTVLLVSVFGTLVTDNLTDNFQLPLSVSTALFALALACAFFVWHASEDTVAIASIDTRRRECFYWAVVFCTFALGTAFGDWASEGLQLGYGVAALLFGAAIACVAAAYYGLRRGATACFWVAYVLTRPFGASCGDLLTQSTDNGGLGLDLFGTNLAMLALIAAGIVHHMLRVRQAPEQAGSR